MHSADAHSKLWGEGKFYLDREFSKKAPCTHNPLKEERRALAQYSEFAYETICYKSIFLLGRVDRWYLKSSSIYNIIFMKGQNGPFRPL